MFASVELVEEVKLYLHVEISRDYYPDEASARFEIRWYRNDDFNFHYKETRPDGSWQCRWDRHPNNHNSRDHFHPPPNASRTNAEDAQFPSHHRDLCRLVLARVEERIATLWEAS